MQKKSSIMPYMDRLRTSPTTDWPSSQTRLDLALQDLRIWKMPLVKTVTFIKSNKVWSKSWICSLVSILAGIKFCQWRWKKYIYYFVFIVLLYSDYMVTKLKEDGLDNVHTEAAQVLKCNIKKCNAIILIWSKKTYTFTIFEFVHSMFHYVLFISYTILI